jgi:hypothetical protein
VKLFGLVYKIAAAARNEHHSRERVALVDVEA